MAAETHQDAILTASEPRGVPEDVLPAGAAHGTCRAVIEHERARRATAEAGHAEYAASARSEWQAVIGEEVARRERAEAERDAFARALDATVEDRNRHLAGRLAAEARVAELEAHLEAEMATRETALAERDALTSRLALVRVALNDDARCACPCGDALAVALARDG